MGRYSALKVKPPTVRRRLITAAEEKQTQKAANIVFQYLDIKFRYFSYMNHNSPQVFIKESTTFKKPRVGHNCRRSQPQSQMTACVGRTFPVAINSS